ncbi:unnamed protein product, partial [Prorocentrum cordatum]
SVPTSGVARRQVELQHGRGPPREHGLGEGFGERFVMRTGCHDGRGGVGEVYESGCERGGSAVSAVGAAMPEKCTCSAPPRRGGRGSVGAFWGDHRAAIWAPVGRLVGAARCGWRNLCELLAEQHLVPAMAWKYNTPWYDAKKKKGASVAPAAAVAEPRPPATASEMDKKVAARRTHLSKEVEAASKKERICQSEVENRLASVLRHREALQQADRAHAESVERLAEAKARSAAALAAKDGFDEEAYRAALREEERTEAAAAARAAEMARAAAPRAAPGAAPPGQAGLRPPPGGSPAPAPGAGHGEPGARAAGGGLGAAGGPPGAPAGPAAPGLTALGGIDWSWIQEHLHEVSEEGLVTFHGRSHLSPEQWREMRKVAIQQRAEVEMEADMASDAGSDLGDRHLPEGELGELRELRKRAAEAGLDGPASVRYGELVSKQAVQRAAKKARRIVQHQSSHTFVAFCQAAAAQLGAFPEASAGGAAQAEDKLSVEYLVAPDGVRQTPGSMMEYRKEFWSALWTPTSDHLKLLNETLDELRAEAQLALLEVPEFTPKDVVQAALRFSGTTAVGVDQWSPRSFLDLPGQALFSLAAIFNQCEKVMAFPQQCYLNVMALLPKSEKDERAVSKCSTMYRMYVRMRGDDVDAWS